MLRFLQSCVVAGLAAFPLQTAAQQADIQSSEEKYVVMWRRVPNNFYSAALHVDDVQQLIDKSPLRLIRLNLGDTISDQLQRQFKVSQTWTPAMYEGMIARIVDLNGLQSPDEVQAGQELLVPVIPQTGRPTMEQSVGVVWSESELDSTTQHFRTPAPEETARTEIQYIKVRASELPKYALESALQQGASGEIIVTFGQAPGAPTESATNLLNPSTSERIRHKLEEHASGISPILIVLDDSIPDHSEYARTRDFLIELSTTVRTQYGFGDSPYFDELSRVLDRLPSETPEHTLYPDLRMHASQIKRALQPLTNLDPAGRIRVTYIPLAATQFGISPFYKEILYLAEMIKILMPTSTRNIKANNSHRNTAKGVVEEIIKTNPSVLVYGPVPFSSHAGSSIRSDRSLIEALTSVLDAYSNATGHPHALSLSWTMPKLGFPAYLVENSYGWKFAAAGNNVSAGQNQDFLARELQFASRAASAKDVVAVLNSDGASGPCASNIFDDSAGIQVLSLAFTGRIDPQRCGTSFSTPRVAWLMAAREVILGKRQIPPVTSYSKMIWNQQQQQLVIGFKSSEPAPVLQRYGLDAAKLLGTEQP